MRFIYLYLIAYFALLIGAGLALWQAGVLQHASPLWTGIVAVFVVALGLLLPLTSASPAPVVTPE
jgi:hypothetical protein